MKLLTTRWIILHFKKNLHATKCSREKPEIWQSSVSNNDAGRWWLKYLSCKVSLSLCCVKLNIVFWLVPSLFCAAGHISDDTCVCGWGFNIWPGRWHVTHIGACLSCNSKNWWGEQWPYPVCHSASPSRGRGHRDMHYCTIQATASTHTSFQ